MLTDDIELVVAYLQNVDDGPIHNAFLRILAELIKEEKFTSTNTGRQFALQMPPSCAECPVKNPCRANKIGTITCHGQLWRHFCHA